MLVQRYLYIRKQEYGVEFAQVYKYGDGTNGGGQEAETCESDWAITEISYDRNGNATKIVLPESGC